MMNHRIKKIYWGIMFILAATFVILKCVGIQLGFIGILSVTDIVLGVLILSLAVGSLVKFNFWALPFEFAVLFMLYESDIAEYIGRADNNIISNWLLLLCALFFSIGLSFIFPSKFHGKNHKGQYVQGVNNVKFGSESKFIDCTDFENAYYSVKMGDANIYFQNTENYQGNGVLNIECKMGNLEIYVPASWHLKTDIVSSLGNLEIPGEGNKNGPLLTINGSNSLGNTEIHFC